MYGENWLYAPAFTRALKLLAASRGTVLEMRGGECHSGSHSPYSKVWRHTGGGALLRMGSHPLGAMLHVKARDGIAPVAVSAEVGDLSAIPSIRKGKTKAWITTGWQDVESWGAAIVTFADGSRGVIWASDTVLGGMQSRLEIFASNCHLQCNLSPHDLLRAYAPDAGVFGEEYLMEKLDTRAGWSTPLPDEDWSAGHLAMCQDFVEAVAQGRPVRSGGALGRDVVRVLYAAYASAAEGRRVEL
jgi:predicted dehydrogenase